MKIIFTILLTLVLVSCGEIRLELGGNDVGEVGTYVWTPQPDTLFEGEVIRYQGYLVDTRTGFVQECVKYIQEDNFTCLYAADPTNTPMEDF